MTETLTIEQLVLDELRAAFTRVAEHIGNDSSLDPNSVLGAPFALFMAERAVCKAFRKFADVEKEPTTTREILTRLAALEGKAGDEAYVNNLRADNRKMALSNAGMTMKIAELERQLMAYRDCANCAESSPPTKRQQVAEKVLDVAVGEWGYLAAADWLYKAAMRVFYRDPDAHDRLVAMGRLLEQAAREEQDA